MKTSGRRSGLSVVAAMVLSLAIAGCAQLQGTDPAVDNYVLAPPAALGREVSAYQRLLVVQGPLSRQFTLAVDIRHASLQLVVMSSLGQRLATWRYRDNRYVLQVEAGAPEELPYRHLLVTLQWLFWPADSLAGVNDKAWRFAGDAVYYHGSLVAKLGRPMAQAGPWEGEYQGEFQACPLLFKLLSTRLD